jgi:polysaccharide export outer membrane protein
MQRLVMTRGSSRCFSALLVALIGAAGCAHSAKFVWADKYEPPPDPAQTTTKIGPGDLIQIRVFGQDQLSTRAKVRPDGKVSVLLLDDVQAAGFAPAALARDLEVRLKPMVKNAVVTVSVEETKQKSVLVVGEVLKPGPVPLDTGTGVLHALVGAGGLSPDASDDRIFVLRGAPAAARIRFRYENLLEPGSPAAGFKLREGDVVVVE